MEYCLTEDMMDRAYINYPYFTHIFISEHPKGQHQIDGWICICGALPDGRECKLYDVWAGKDYKYLNKIYLELVEACKRTGLGIEVR